MSRLKNRAVKMQTKGWIKASLLSWIIAVALSCWANTLRAQALTAEEQAKKLGEVASRSESAGYVFGVIAVACMGLVAYSIKSKDEAIREASKESTEAQKLATQGLNDLAKSIRNQTEIFKAKAEKDERAIEVAKTLAESNREMSGKPCALESAILADYIRGKVSGQH